MGRAKVVYQRSNKVVTFEELPPHDGQQKILDAMDRFKVVIHSPGRRWG